MLIIHICPDKIKRNTKLISYISNYLNLIIYGYFFFYNSGVSGGPRFNRLISWEFVHQRQTDPVIRIGNQISMSLNHVRLPFIILKILRQKFKRTIMHVSSYTNTEHIHQFRLIKSKYIHTSIPQTRKKLFTAIFSFDHYLSRQQTKYINSSNRAKSDVEKNVGVVYYQSTRPKINLHSFLFK